MLIVVKYICKDKKDTKFKKINRITGWMTTAKFLRNNMSIVNQTTNPHNELALAIQKYSMEG